VIYIIDNIYEYLLEPIIELGKKRCKTYNKIMQFLSGFDSFFNAILDLHWMLNNSSSNLDKVWKREFYNSLNGKYSDIELFYEYPY